MLSFPHAKINLGLHIVAKRPDGYHDLESCFYPIPWTDALEVTKADTFSFVTTGLSIPGDENNNLCIKAYLLMKDTYSIGPVHIHLHKAVPMGAGLGGGSSDGAFTIRLLNELYQLELTTPEMEHLAAQLGSDCPFFTQDQAVFATGTGTTFQPADIDLSGKYLAIKHPEIHVDTKNAYSQVVPHKPPQTITDLLKMPMKDWKDHLINDFETAVFQSHPEIQAIKEQLYENGAIYASMSGSGSAVYGIFETEPTLTEFHLMKI